MDGPTGRGGEDGRWRVRWRGVGGWPERGGWVVGGTGRTEIWGPKFVFDGLVI